MSNARWGRVEQIFNEAVSLSSGERAARLDALCAGDAGLRAEVESLLAHDDATNGPQATGVRASIERMAADLVQAAASERIGERLGNWQLKSLIARGGMGAVYLAERADGQFEQRAAIKVIGTGSLSDEALRRFHGERQILANLDHPSVARLVDGGTAEDGTPWLAMEFVDGIRIDEYCTEEGLDLRELLELFRKVCGAVQYAHRNLVIHRDIKPSNILVDRDGGPRLLDFGVAKLFGGARQDPTITVADRRVLTPRYSSPEQLRGQPLTTATDVYSLCVLLYELLTGRDPYGPEASEPVSLHKAICETDPQPPSAWIIRGPGAAPTPLAAKRTRRAIRGDLDNIVLMGLRKEPERRYASVQELSDDIERFLNDEPVEARLDTWTYRSAKFLKRRRVPILAAACALLMLAASSAFFVNRIVIERDAAEAARVRAEEIAQFLQELLRGADRFASAGRDVSVRDILDVGAERVRTELEDQPVEQARLMQTIGDTYHALSLYEPAMEYTELALELRGQALGPSDVETLQSMRELGVLTYLSGGDTESALALLEQTLELQLAALGAASGEIVPTYHEIGVVQRILGNPRAALEALSSAREVLSTLPVEHSERRNEPLIVNQIGSALDSMNDREGALATYREALALFESTDREDHPVVGALTHNIGLTLRAQGKLDEALPYLEDAVERTRRTLGEESEDYEVQLSSLGRTLAQLGRFDEAGVVIDKAVAVAETLYGTEHQYYAYNLVNVARLRQLEGRHAEAVAVFERTVAIYRAAFGSYHRFLAAAEIGLADSLVETGRASEADALIAGTLARMRDDPDHERQVEAVGRSVRGRALELLGRSEEARPLLVASLTDLRRIVGDSHQLTAQAAQNLVTFLEDRGEPTAADEYRALLAASPTPQP